MPNFVKIVQSVAEILRFFVFFKDGGRSGPSAILDKFGAYLDHHLRVLGGLYHRAKIYYDRCSIFDNINVSIFGIFGWRKPINAPKIGFLGYLTP